MYTQFGINYNPKTFKIWYSPCSQTSGTWPDEIKNAAITISQSTNRDIWICMSGGVDSEIVAQTFKNLKIPFKVLIAKFSNELNEHDISYAVKWCNTNHIEYKFFNFDMLLFLNEGYKKYLNQDLVANNVFRYYTIELLQQVEDMNGFCVLGGKSAGLSLKQQIDDCTTLTDNAVYDTYDIGSLAPLEWCRKNNLNHCVFFYQATSEIHQSYLNDPVNQMLINNPYILRGAVSVPAKTLIVRSHFPNMAPRIKYHGFEKISSHRLSTQIQMAKYFGLDPETKDKRFKTINCNNQIEIPITEVFQQLQYIIKEPYETEN